MSANLVQDWLQIAAGAFAVLGIFFLAIGTFSKDDRKDARYIAPILTGAVLAVAAGYETYSDSSGEGFYQMLTSFIPLGVLISIVVGISFVFGYFFGYVAFNEGDVGKEFRQYMWLFVWVLIVAAPILWLVLLLLRWVTIGSGHFWAEVIVYASAVLSFLAVAVVARIPPNVLKAMGLLSSVIAVGLAIWPAIADLLGTSIK